MHYNYIVFKRQYIKNNYFTIEINNLVIYGFFFLRLLLYLCLYSFVQFVYLFLIVFTDLKPIEFSFYYLCSFSFELIHLAYIVLFFCH